MKLLNYLCAAILLSAFFSKSALAQSKTYTMPLRGICAHRGGLDTHPENTLPAFKNAIAMGVQMIEFDIHLSKDSVLVIMHDDAVDRTTNGTGKIADLTLAQIKELDAGIKKGEAFAGAKVLTLEETLAMMPRNIWLNCHLKGGAAVGKATALMVAKTGRLQQCLLASSEEASVAARQAVPSIIICNAENRYRQDNKQYVAATIQMKAPFIQLLAIGTAEERQPFIRQLKDNQVLINYYYATKSEQAKELWDAGIDFILVNNLPLFVPELKKNGIEPVVPQY